MANFYIIFLDKVTEKLHLKYRPRSSAIPAGRWALGHNKDGRNILIILLYAIISVSDYFE